MGTPGQTALPVSPAPAWSAAAARDRLSSTGFLAALFHGIVILGVTFGASDAGHHDELTSTLEVVVVTSDREDLIASDSAVLLAQKTLVGAGNAAPDATLRTALGSAAPADLPGPLQTDASADVRSGEFEPFRDSKPMLLANESPLTAADEGLQNQQAMARRQAMTDDAEQADVIGRLSDTTVIPDARIREFLISANTRESRVAAYLNVWKQKVEQTGTLNFPVEAQHAGHAHPVLEVAINADGSLRDVIVRSSSGQRGLDQAAMDILRLASPFEPFPDALRANHDVLRFAYEWRFSEATGTVRASAAAP